VPMAACLVSSVIKVESVLAAAARIMQSTDPMDMPTDEATRRMRAAPSKSASGSNGINGARSSSRRMDVHSSSSWVPLSNSMATGSQVAAVFASTSGRSAAWGFLR